MKQCLQLTVTILGLALSSLSVHGQFYYVTNYDGNIVITGYGGPGGIVTIPDAIDGLPVTSIGLFAFMSCAGLTGVTIPGSVTRLEDGAFMGCGSLTMVSLPNSVTNIGGGVFLLCTSLASITIPNSVISIGGVAFQGCTSLTSITVPSSVTTIGGLAFSGCFNLSSINVDSVNPAYSSADGVLFDKNKSTLLEYPGGKMGEYTIPSTVTNIAVQAFSQCTNLTGITMGTSLVSIGNEAFAGCINLAGVTIPNSLISIGAGAFSECASLTTFTVPNRVTYIGQQAFSLCTNLTGVYFQGNAPSLGGAFVFEGDNQAIVYYLAGTTGWGGTYGGRPTVLLSRPGIEQSPATQTAEAGSTVHLRVQAGGSSPLFCLWYLDSTNLLSCSTNCDLLLTNLQFSQAGGYTAILTNAAGAVTSSPAMLQVIAPVERRLVPGVQTSGEQGSLLNLECADSLHPGPKWTQFGVVTLTSSQQYLYDITLPLPPQRFFRAWQTGAPAVVPDLDLHLVTAITLTGNVGQSLRLDSINRFGPIDAWVTLATLTLTNTSQLYFDASAVGQPQRLYRVIQVP